MPANRPEWTHTHKQWKALKARDKKSKYPNTGTGKALDKIQTLYKKIDWDAFEEFSKRNILLQDFYKLHGEHIAPFVKEVVNTSKKIKGTDGMPYAGQDFSDEMMISIRSFALDGKYFSNLIKNLESIKKIKDTINSASEKFLKLDFKGILSDKAAALLFWESGTFKRAQPIAAEFIASFPQLSANKIYDEFFDNRKKAIAIEIKQAGSIDLKEKRQNGKLNKNELLDFVPFIRGLINIYLRHVVDDWKLTQYKKYGLQK